MHAHSRLASLRECQENTKLPKSDPSELVLTVGADIWFAPRRTELKAMTPPSRQELDALIQKLDVQYKNASQIRVQITGRADDTYQNEELAKARSQIVICICSATVCRRNRFTLIGVPLTSKTILKTVITIAAQS
jgi:hypothetical protein